MRELVEPDSALYEAWSEAHEEWGPGLHEDGFGLWESDDVATAEGFSAWVTRLRQRSDQTSFRWIVEDGRVQGAIALRHQGDEHAGHIGYGVRPSARGRGVATWALAQMLARANEVGLDAVELVCEADNRASRSAIERNGGRLIGTLTEESGAFLRYRIDLAPEYLRHEGGPPSG